MTDTSQIKLEMKLDFPNAGVSFSIAVTPPATTSNGQAATFSLKASDSSGQRSLPFNVETSPQLADWVRGYSRWLYRAGVTATHDESGITGTFNDHRTPEQILSGLQEACDMIRQRFDMYSESILV